MQQKKPFNLSLLIGNSLILLSLVGFIFLFYPIIQLYISPPQVELSENETPKGYVLYVPKINAYSTVLSEIDPYNKSAYMAALKKGVAQAKGTSLPGKKGSIYLFAHSSGNPFEMNRYNTVFYRLGELGVNDKIILYLKGKKYTYEVYDKKEVWPSEIKYLKEAQKNMKDELILQTCTPIGTSLKRLLVFARPT